MSDTAVTDRPPLDLNLLDLALDHIEEHPEEWEQGAWRCRTGMCLAGHIAILAGARWQDLADTDNSTVVTPRGPMPVQRFAREELGIDRGESVTLFAPTNTLPQLRAMRASLAVGELIALPPCDCDTCTRYTERRTAARATAVRLDGGLR